MDDYKNAEGNIDWAAYRKARVAAGEVCYKCGHYLMFSKNIPELCYPCKNITEDKDECAHDHYIRCPKCKYIWDPSEEDDYEVYSDGDHGVCCGECGHEFDITTSVSYSFTSPELLSEEDKNE